MGQQQRQQRPLSQRGGQRTVCVRCGENNNNMIVKENVENEMDFVSRNGENFSENAS